MYGYIYLTTNTINNKQYIGQHKAETFDKKYKGSGKVLTQAFKKYGKENFNCIILKECYSKEELDNEEIKYIKNFDCVNSNNFYNLKDGGSGGGQKGLIYIRKDNVLKRVKPEELDTYLLNGFEIGGYIPGEEEKINRAKSHVGLKYHHSKNFIENGSKSIGYKRPAEVVEKIAAKKRGKSTSRKGKISIINKDNNVLYINKKDLDYYKQLGYEKGFKKHSKEACENLSIAKSNTVCIHRENIIKYIKPELLDSYVNAGWVIGRGSATRPNQKEEHRRWMTDGYKNKMIKECEIQKYLDDGFVFGKAKNKTQ